MAKPSPFDYIKSINHKDYKYDLVGYVPFLTNRCFAMHIDTVMLAEQMNQCHKLSPELQYDFYYYVVRKGKRFGFPPKPEEVPNLELIQEYFGYSRQKAIEALRLLTTEDIRGIIKKSSKGGQ
jgi:hypothetical protein